MIFLLPEVLRQTDVYGMSDDYPIADNTNEDGRSKNRRIEIIRED